MFVVIDFRAAYPLAGIFKKVGNYNWSLPAGWSFISGSGTRSITVNVGNSAVSGFVTVSASNACGNGASSNLMVNVGAGVPTAPGAITGNSVICSGTPGLTYSVAAIAGATSYSWTLPQGWTITSGANTRSITVTSGTAGGNITVRAINACGSSLLSSLPVSINPIPATPGVITGQTVLCAGMTYQYSVAVVAGASRYNWLLPSGWSITSSQTTSNTVTVALSKNAKSGVISVTAGNSCGQTSAARTLSTTVNKCASETNTALVSTELDMDATQFNMIATPNPTTSQFTIRIESGDRKTPMSLRIVDSFGQLLETKYGLVPGQVLQIGANYRPGIYFVELIQGSSRKVVKLVKLSN